VVVVVVFAYTRPWSVLVYSRYGYPVLRRVNVCEQAEDFDVAIEYRLIRVARTCRHRRMDDTIMPAGCALGQEMTLRRHFGRRPGATCQPRSRQHGAYTTSDSHHTTAELARLPIPAPH
jgi:hypothetical protein